MIDINLLPARNVVSQKESEFQKKFFLGLWLCSLVVAVDLVIFFLVSQVYKRQVQQLVTKRADLTSASERLSGVALDLRTVEEKTRGFTVVSALRQDIVETMGEVRSLAGKEVEMTDLKIGISTVGFFAKAADVSVLNGFVNRAVDGSVAPHLQNIVLGSLRLDPSGSFGFQVAAARKDNRKLP